MDSAARIERNKATGEARKLLLQLQMAGQSSKDIALALGVEARKLTAVRKGATRGDELVAPLRGIIAQLATKPTPPTTGKGTDSTAGESTAADPVAEAPEVHAVVAPAPSGGTLPAELGGVSAPEMERPERAGLVDRLKGLMLGGGGDATVSAPPARGATRAKSELQAQFVNQVLPVVALVVAWGSELAIKDPYKPCAPTVQEASAMLIVPIRRIARELDIRQKLTEGTMDMVIMLLAVAGYGRRAHATYRSIKDAQETQDNNRGAGARDTSHDGPRLSPDQIALYGGRGHGRFDPSAAAAANDRRGADASSAGNGRRHGVFGGRPGRPDASTTAGQSGRAVHGPGAGGIGQHPGSGADPISELLAADYEGRLRLGMVG